MQMRRGLYFGSVTRSVWWLLLAVTTFVLLWSPVVASASQAVDPAVSIANTPESLDSLATTITSLGERNFPDTFGSTMISPDGSHLDVFLTSLDPEIESALQSAAPSGTLSFNTTALSVSELSAVHALVTELAPSLEASGIKLVSWFPGINGDGLEHIGVVGLTPSQLSTLDANFGANNIVVTDVPATSSGQFLGRNSDATPWSGGDNILGIYTSTLSAECTTGPGIIVNGTAYTLEASHCFQPGMLLYNELPGGSGSYMGQDYSNVTAQNADDTALLAVTPSDLIWTGVIGSPVVEVDTGDATNPAGDTVCNEGAMSGEVCSTVVSSNYGCWTGYDEETGGNRTICHLVEAETESNGVPINGIAGQTGDSGGPMIRYVSGALKVTGIVSVGLGTVVPCQYNTSGATCYNTVLYTAMDQILSGQYPGASLVTG